MDHGKSTGKLCIFSNRSLLPMIHNSNKKLRKGYSQMEGNLPRIPSIPLVTHNNQFYNRGNVFDESKVIYS